MRANDLDCGLLSDVFSFTMIQEFTAIQLRLQLGTYTHTIGSAHVNGTNAERVRRAAATLPAPTATDAARPPPTHSHHYNDPEPQPIRINKAARCRVPGATRTSTCRGPGSDRTLRSRLRTYQN
ncbi:hypothetical protein ACWDG1_48185 [Streptomyces sp. NPDC001177]